MLNSSTNQPGHAHSLSANVRMFPNQKFAETAEIYRGTGPIVVKLVEESSKEATILEKLNHHNVISFIQSGSCEIGIERKLYIAIEECHQENLRQFVENRKKACTPFDLNYSFGIAKQIISGLEYVHSQKIIHKDVNPDNILFSLDQKTVKIADFGLSEELETVESKKEAESEFGTAGYRPPESFGRGIISLKSDIFPLGAVLYFIFSSGKNPFGDDRDIQNYNIKYGCISLSDLLVSNVKTTKHLISCMLENKLNDRPTIEQVSKHPCWTGKEEECNFDYRSSESSSPDSHEKKEPVEFQVTHPLPYRELMKMYNQRREGTFLAQPESVDISGSASMLVGDRGQIHAPVYRYEQHTVHVHGNLQFVVAEESKSKVPKYSNADDESGPSTSQ